MSFSRLLPILCLVSLLLGFVSVFSGLLLAPPVRENRYAVLAADEALSDPDIRRALEDLFGVEIISESSQWALLDDFGRLERIPLDEYKNRLEPRDPRGDGYADKLRSFFVRDGKRLFFIPLSGKGPGPGLAEKRISALLGDIPFSLEYPGAGTPVLFYFLLFCCAAFGGLYFSGAALPILPCLPLSLGLAFLGLPGIVLGALLAGLSVLLRGPAMEFCTLLHAGKGPSNPAEYRRQIIRNVFVLRRYHWLLALVFAAACVLLVVFAVFDPSTGRPGAFSLFAAGLLFVYPGLLFFSLMVFSRRGDAEGHVRFFPVPIIKGDVPVPAFSRVMLPYGLAVMLALLLNPFLPAAPSASSFAGDSTLVVNEADYLAHLEFQRGFSFRSLETKEPGGDGRTGGQSGNTDGESYLEFVLGGDGLLHAAGPLQPATDFPPGQDLEIPPFPLKNLTDFLLQNGSSPGGSSPDVSGPAGNGFGRLVTGLSILSILSIGPGDLLAVFIAALFIILSGFWEKIRKQPGFASDYRLRWGDKKRKKILLYRRRLSQNPRGFERPPKLRTSGLPLKAVFMKVSEAVTLRSGGTHKKDT
ncbi:MAG: hypothetical protein LBJ90_02695 [Treponema sp.]|jgi:hypothetical protein|nr:hypothetical protein [Treponema sp.]